MVVVEEPRPLVSVTLSVWSVCQNAGWWTSHCLRTASTTHGLRSPLPLQAHGEAAEMNSYRTGTRSEPLSPEGGGVLARQEGLRHVHPGAADQHVIGHLTGNAQQPRGIWESE